jgi:hypothetical protein
MFRDDAVPVLFAGMMKVTMHSGVTSMMKKKKTRKD